MKQQKSIHISFTKDDFDLYNDIMRESTLRLIPISTLIRFYLRNGQKAANTSNLLQTYETSKSSTVSL
jgi:hypothetical protein